MVSAWRTRPGGAFVGVLADRRFGEPPARLHPIAAFGTLMERVERRLWADQRSRGVAFCALGVGGSWVLGAAAESVLGEPVALATAVTLCGAGRALTDSAATVAARLDEGDLDGARQALRALVGRDVERLDEKEIARAAIESLAENLSDALVATVLWGLLCGAPGALAHRATNTLDAMVGHRSARHCRFGWASARLDDLLGWPAARATAMLVAFAVPRRVRSIVRACRVDAPRHPSPNAGVAEAAFAAALDLELGGTNTYGGRIEERPILGAGSPPSAQDIGRAIALVRRVTLVLETLLLLAALVSREPPPRLASGAPGDRR